jgi:hypothetical protein
MSNRTERLREYAKPLRRENWQGAGRDQANIDRWSERASQNCDGADHRASSGEVQLPSTGKRQEVRDTAMSPRTSRKVDAAMRGKDDLNFVGSSPFMRDVRRTT